MSRSGRRERGEALKPDGPDADVHVVRFQRLILEAGANAVTMRFHPRLTVVAGLGRAEREMLVTEVMGSLAGGRGGAHMEVVDDTGRRLGLIRPANGDSERVVDADSGEDLTSSYTGGGSGVPDLLARLGLTAAEARRLCRVTAADMAVESQGDSVMRSLAGVEQTQLWAAAERLVVAEERLNHESAQAGTEPEDGPLIEEIERRHAAFEKAERRHESFRHHWIFIGGACAVGAVPAALMNRVTALPFLAVAAVTTVLSILARRRKEGAKVAEGLALAQAGAQSYIGFQIQRVDRLLDGQKSLARLASASEEHRRALELWRGLGGDASADWALAHREEIEELVARRAGRVNGPATGVHDVDPADLAHWLAARFTGLRKVGASASFGGESLPLILDDPLVGVEAGVKQWILELIGRSAGTPQVVYLSADPDVAAWARLEAMAGHLAVVEPAPEQDDVDTYDEHVVELSGR